VRRAGTSLAASSHRLAHAEHRDLLSIEHEHVVAIGDDARFVIGTIDAAGSDRS
jgi:hypothetical protein